MSKFQEDMTLAAARDVLRTLVYEGHNCPLCTQMAKVYKRRINSGMAVSIIKMYRSTGLGWQHVPTTVGARSREEGKLRYWGLVEEESGKREDGGRAGWWRVTPRGEAYVQHKLALPTYALVYNSRCLGHEGKELYITAALGKKFNYNELMAGV